MAYNLARLFFIILILFTVFNCIFICKTSSSLIKTWKRNPGSWLGLIIKIVFMLSAIFLILNAILILFSYPDLLLLVTFLNGNTFYLIGLPLVLLSFLWRLNERFKSTNLAPSRCCNISFAICVLIQILSLLVMLSLALANQMYAAFINYIIFSGLNLVSNVFLLCMFGDKICVLGKQMVGLDTLSFSIHDGSHNSGEMTTELTVELTKTMESSTLTKTPTPTDVSTKKRPQRKNKLLTKTVRNMSGAIMAFIASNLVNILGIYRMHGHADPDQMLWIIHSLCITMSHTINLSCLHLQHKQSRRWSNRHCAVMYACVARILIGKSMNRDSFYSKSERVVALNDHEIRPYSTTSTLTESSAPIGLPRLHRDRITDVDTSNSDTM
eukprot:201760_1